MSEDQLPYNEVIGLKKLSENQFQSLHPPITMGGSSAYGGASLALGLHAAYHTLDKDSKHKPYSLQGHYLGPTSSDEVVNLRVTNLRQTRTFATRLVIVSQEVESEGEKKIQRDCLSMVIDFIVTGDRNMITYSAPPLDQPITHHSKIKNTIDSLEDKVQKGEIAPFFKEVWQSGYAPMLEIFEQKSCPESILSQNMMGMLHKKSTNQDSRKVQHKTGYDWFRVRLPIEKSSSTQAIPLAPDSASPVFLAFALDGAIPFLPLAFNGVPLMDAEVNTASDFALRFHCDQIDPNAWFLRELRTIAAGNEMTYNEARCWIEDEHTEGGLKLVATMTQACILRSKEGKSEKDRGSRL